MLPIALYAPENFDIAGERNRRCLIEFLDKLNQAITVGKVHIDFSNTVQMNIEGTLLFWASLDYLASQLSSGSILREFITCSYPIDPIVEQVLQHVGIFDVMGKQGRAIIEHHTVKHWCACKGTSVDGPKIGALNDFYMGTIASEIITGNLYSGIIEAMTNCGHHAYPSREVKPWWMFSQEKEGHLTIAFCDLGIGIHESMRASKKWLYDDVVSLLRQHQIANTDGAMIRIAIDLGRSQTREPNRGKGLPEIRKVLEERKDGRLRIFSGRGLYRFEPATGVDKYDNYNESIPGTFISWHLPILKEVDDG